MTARRRLSALILLLLVAAPSLAHACAVCFDPKDRNRGAFAATTAFLSVLPVGMVGGTALWLRRRMRALRGLPPQETPPGTSTR